MDASKATCHLRSISLPSKTHPLITMVEEQLVRLRASGASNSTGYKLGGLKDLYASVDDLIQLHHTQDALSSNNKVEEMLDGSLRVLDVCGATRDVFSQMKECVRKLESSLRRRNRKSVMENEVRAYKTMRNWSSNVTSKCFGNSKRVEKSCKASISDEDLDLADVLKQVEETSLVVFESLLSQLCPYKVRSRQTGWLLVSRLIKSRHTDGNEIEQMDAKLLSLIGKNSSPVQVQDVLERLMALESSIQEVEEELEGVYRSVLKTRVAVLNILHH